MSDLIDREKLDRLAAQITRPVLDGMLVKFVDRLDESAGALAAAARGADPVALRHEAHKLVGVAGTFGAEAVASGARAVEQAVDEGRHAEGAAAVSPLLKTIEATVAALRPKRP